MDSNSEDIDANDAGVTTLCVLLAAIDSAPTPKATSLMNNEAQESFKSKKWTRNKNTKTSKPCPDRF